jgi:hypothetical protein
VGAPTPRLLALARPVSPLSESANRFAAYLSELERRVRRAGQEVAAEVVKRELSEKITSLAATFARAEETWPKVQIDAAKREVREILGPWLWRSELWSRALYKPHGYAGDFGLFERLEAVANHAKGDPLKPALVACLDHAFAELDLARAIQERRGHLTRMLLRERFRKQGPLSILDVSPRGARHVADYAGALRDAGAEQITIVDDDPAALSFLEDVAFAPWNLHPRSMNAPLHRVRHTLSVERFDAILVSSHLDVLDDEAARESLDHLASCLAKNGVLIALNTNKSASSRNAREWLLEWPCYERGADELAALMPDNTDVVLSESGLLSIATYRKT